MKLSGLFVGFFNSEKAGGMVLLACTALSLLLANLPAGESYVRFWHFNLGGQPLEYWINDGLMTIFFLLIGLELKRELYKGELSDPRNAVFPAIGAAGGMLVPAFIYWLFNKGTATQSGIGIPMATDIAFALGILSLLGRRVPASLKVFLAALAVIDDLGAIIVIAVFYSKGVVLANLGIALAIFGLLLLLNRLKVRSLIPYIAGGVVMWYCMLHSGVHATISGVLLAFTIPFSNGEEKSASYKLQHFLHKPVSFFILPVFALANTCIIIHTGWTQQLGSAGSLGILMGLVIGKPLGIILFCLLGVAAGLCRLPLPLGWKHIAGAGMLGGIGFTMSIFITLLAFDNATHITMAKMAILFSSLLAAISGLVWLYRVLPAQALEEDAVDIREKL